jgi:hypothetical protein
MKGICETPQTSVITIALLKPQDFSHDIREHPEKAPASGLSPPIQLFQIRPSMLTLLFVCNWVEFTTEVNRFSTYPPHFYERSYNDKYDGYVCHYL